MSKMPEKESGELYALGLCLHRKRDAQKFSSWPVSYLANEGIAR